jgi:hypothetical protein
MIISIEIPEYHQSSPISTYSRQQLIQGIAQARHAHNLASGKQLTDSEWVAFVVLENAGNWHRSYRGSADISPSSISPSPSWAGLIVSAFSGNLGILFQRLTNEAQSSSTNDLAVARGDLIIAITSIKNEQALASSIAMIRSAGFIFTEAEKDSWNNQLEELYFGDAAKIV